MDLNKLSDDDLRALSVNNLKAMSDEGLRLLAGGAAPSGKKGIGAALGKGVESTLGSAQTTLESLFGADEAAKRGLAREEAIGKKYEDQIGLDKLKEAYEKKGLTGAGGELLRQVPLALTEQAPNIAASLGSARLGAMAGSAFGPVGAGIGALGGALVPSALQLFGSNVQRQAAEQQQAGQPTDINVGRALGATAIQAPLDVVATFIPLGGKVAGKIFGPEVEKLLMRGGTKAAEKLAEESFAKTLGKGLATGAAAEIPTEIMQQVAERAQAGLSLTSPEALKEYGETAYQVGLLAPIGGAGRFVDRSAARSQVEAKKQEESRVAAEAAKEQQRIAQETQQAQEFQKAQQETGSLFGEAAPEASPYTPPQAPSNLTVREREYSQIADLEAQAKAATDPVEKRKLETEVARLKEQPTERMSLLKEADTYDKQLLDIEKQRDAAAEKGDFKQFATLDAQARALEESSKKVSASLKELPVDLTPDMEMAKLRGEQKNLIKQLQGMTGPSYDAKKAATVTAKLEEIDKRITEITPAAGQMELFDEAQMGAEERAYKNKQAETRSQEQADLIEALKPEGRREVLDKQAIERYQKGLADLEEAYAVGADERVINRLIDELQRVGENKDETIAKAGAPTGVEQEEALVKLQRIKRAIDEEATKLAGATTDEEVNAIRTNIGALQKRYGAAQTERAKAQPQNVEIEASQEQRDAILQAVENVRLILSGEYINSRNVDVASSLKSALEDRIRDAGSMFTTAAIKEINAVRALSGAIQRKGTTERIGGQKPLTNDEALKLASAIKERFDYLAYDPTYLANREIEIGRLKKQFEATPKADTKRRERLETAISELEKNRNKNLTVFKDSLEKIKSSFYKGETKLAKAEGLREERSAVEMLREATGKQAAENLERVKKAAKESVAKVQKELDDAIAKEAPIKAQVQGAYEEPNNIVVLRDRLKETKKQAKENVKEATDAVNNFVYDEKRVAQLQKEIAAGKAEDERTAAEKAKQEAVDLERYAPSGISPDQKELFGERQLKPVAVVRATPENFQRFVGIQANKFKQAKAVAERAIAEAKERATKAKERADAKAAETAQELTKQIAEQRNLVEDLLKKDILISDLQGQATRLWQERGRLVKQANAAETTLKDTKKKLSEHNKQSIAGWDTNSKKTQQFLDTGRRLEIARDNAKLDLNSFQKQIQEIDSVAKERSVQIDELHAKANELKNANLEREQALLDRLEKAYAKTPEAKAKQAVITARAEIGKTETAIRESLEKQVKEKRKTEEQRAASLKGLPFVRQEVVATKRKAVGTGETLARKKSTALVFPGTKDLETGEQLTQPIRYPVTPKTPAEKQAEARARATEGAAERKADKEAIAARLEQGLSGTVANAKEQLVSLEAKLKKVEKDIETSQNKKPSPAESVRRKKMAALQKQLKDAITELKEKGVAAERGAETIGAQPGRAERKKPLNTGPKKINVAEEGEKALSYIKKKTKDLEQEARDLGISNQDFEFVSKGLEFGFKAREETAPSTKGKVSQADVKKELSKIKLPKGLKIVVLDKLSGSLAEKIQVAGHDTSKVRGGVLPDGTVIFVAENHTDLNDVKETIAHELIGHLGVEKLLGEAGMRALAKQIQKTENSVFELAKKLGVFDDVLATYANARRTKSEEDSVLDAVRELIAHTEEATPTKNFLEKARDFIKAMVGAVRASLRKMGLDLDISTSDIYKILRDARKQFNEGAPGAYVNKDGDILFRTKPAVANAGFEDILGFSDKIVAKEKSFIDKIKGEATGLIFKTKYIDRFAPVEAVSKGMEDPLKATQLMYFLRMHDQRMAWTSEVASNGPMALKKAADGKGLILETTPGANLKDMAAALREADVGNAEATSRIFTMYLAAKRAANPKIGLAKLNFGDQVTQKMLDDTMKAVENNPTTKAAFEKAAGIYNEYNNGLINFAVQTGAISKDDAAKLLKDKDYVPFYRQRSDGSVFLEIGGAPAIKIGNLKDQPYLHELVGGDKPIFDVYTSALQNTSMLTDMALRNLATRNVAFALGDLGLLKVGEKEKGVGIHRGDGPTGPTIVHFKIDGENHWANVNSEAAGIPAELLVKGLEGVNTSLPNAVKAMNVPANLLRKWVTRNPAYALRQVIRDPLNAVMTTGLDTIPVVSSFKEIAKMIRGKSEGEPLLQRRGILGGQVLTGTAEDVTKILRDITAGKKGWDYRMAQLDQLAIQGDASTRVVMYNNFIKQGLSEMEATLATLESMNFSKRGISPSLFALSTMVPFMNAQIQGLNVLYQAFRGNMPFNEKLKVKQKLVQRGLMMMAFTMLYASLMEDDESYKNANDDERYGNWFVPNPLGEEYIKVPIPFEIGLIFKAIPEAVVNTAWGDQKARDALSAIGKMTWNSVPISAPQGIKPALEVAINHSFFTGRSIESDRLQRFEPGERYDDRTSEVSKLIGGTLNISPTKLDYLIRGYTGSLPLAVASLANPILRGGEKGEQPDTRGMLSSETPLIGSFFQAKDAGGLVNKAYKDMAEINQSKETYNKLVEEGRDDEAQAYVDANADMIGMASFAGAFRKKMGDLTKAERRIRSDQVMSGAQKRAELDAIKQDKIALAKDFISARE